MLCLCVICIQVEPEVDMTTVQPDEGPNAVSQLAKKVSTSLRRVQLRVPGVVLVVREQKRGPKHH